MSRNVFISFVGFSEYVTCNYYFENEDDKIETRFVQEAIIRHEFKDWTENDAYYFFATSNAYKNNWEDGTFEFDDDRANIYEGKPKDGLKTVLEDIQNVEPCLIDEGHTEDGIWSIFDKIEKKIQEHDCVYLDITHAFRSLPMLGIVLLNYLKATKKITIGEIYYGAFEKLGTTDVVRGKKDEKGRRVKEGMKLEDRNAPVLKLRSFNDIMNFSFAAKLFQDYGNADLLCKSIDETWPRPKTEFERTLRSNLSNKLRLISCNLQTCRGGQIYDATAFKNLDDTFEKLRDLEDDENANYKALGPLLKLVKDKFGNFETNKNLNNGFTAAQWCFEHGMYQQCVTLLQETIVSFGVNFVFEEQLSKDCENYEIRKCRTLIEKYLQYDSNRKDHPAPDSWEDLLQQIIEECNDLKKKSIEEKLEKLQCLRSNYHRLSTNRNNINHAGLVVKACIKGDTSDTQKNTTAKSIREHIGNELKAIPDLLNIISQENT